MTKTPNAPLAGGALGNQDGSGRPSYSPSRLPCQGIIADIADAVALQDTTSWYHLKLKAAHQFSTLNGWRFTWSSFSPEDIGKRFRGKCPPHDLFDHPLFFRGDGRNAALVGQPYYPDTEWLRREGEALAAKLELVFSIAPNPMASFHYPGNAFFAVLHPRNHVVQWLPEQY